MTHLPRLTAVVLTVILATSMVPVSAGPITAPTSSTGAMAGTADVGTDSTQDQRVTEVDSCRSITEPGHYELTTDLESDDTCINIGASNVTFDGNGHTVATNERSTGHGVRIGGDNVTVTNLTLTGWDESIRVSTARDVTVADSRVVNGSIEGQRVHGILIENTTLEQSTISFNEVFYSNMVGIDGDGARIHVSEGINSTVRDSTLEKVTYEEMTGVTIANNTPGDSGWFAIELRLMGGALSSHYGFVTITNNTITGNTADSGADAGIDAGRIHNLTVTDNQIVGNDIGIRIGSITSRDGGCIPGDVEVHGNSIANNSEYGIFTGDSTNVNATNNYWGPDGPSSQTSEPLEDPETGALADGDGSAVSEHPDESGVSNVRFDPWLDHDPTDDTENETN